jgi:hypothetical protein
MENDAKKPIHCSGWLLEVDAEGVRPKEGAGGADVAFCAVPHQGQSMKPSGMTFAHCWQFMGSG